MLSCGDWPTFKRLTAVHITLSVGRRSRHAFTGEMRMRMSSRYAASAAVHAGLSGQLHGSAGEQRGAPSVRPTGPDRTRRSHWSFQWTDHEVRRENLTDRRLYGREIDLADQGRWMVRRTALTATAAAADDDEDAVGWYHWRGPFSSSAASTAPQCDLRTETNLGAESIATFTLSYLLLWPASLQPLVADNGTPWANYFLSLTNSAVSCIRHFLSGPFRYCLSTFSPVFRGSLYQIRYVNAFASKLELSVHFTCQNRCSLRLCRPNIDLSLCQRQLKYNMTSQCIWTLYATVNHWLNEHQRKAKSASGLTFGSDCYPRDVWMCQGLHRRQHSCAFATSACSSEEVHYMQSLTSVRCWFAVLLLLCNKRE